MPARGNSKGIKNKNLKKIKGLSLVEHAGNVLKKISWIDYSIISSDSDKIIEAAKKSSLECIFKRPKNISGHRISDHSVMIHALKAVEKSKKDDKDISENSLLNSTVASNLDHYKVCPFRSMDVNDCPLCKLASL